MFAVCYSADHDQSSLRIHSYTETIKEFEKRYKANKNAFENRKKGCDVALFKTTMLEKREKMIFFVGVEINILFVYHVDVTDEEQILALFWL